MGHEWLFEVLKDMKAYARRHGLEAFASKLDEAEATAREEAGGGKGCGGGLPQKPARRS